MAGHLARHLFVTRTRHSLAIFPMAFLAVFFVLPVFTTLAGFLRLDVFLDTATDTFFVKIAWFSLWQAVLSVLATLAVGLPATWALSRYSFPASHLVRGILSAPFVMPAVVVASGVLAVLPERYNTGVVAIVWAHVLFNISVVVRVVGPRWELLDQSLEGAAALLGATPWRTFTTVVWPHIRHAVMNAALLVFIYCFTSFGVIVIVGGFSRRTLEAEIFTQAIRLGDTRTATALALIQVLCIAMVFALARWQRGNEYPVSQTQHLRPLTTKTHHRWHVPFATVAALVVIVAPLSATVFRSFYNNATQSFSLLGWQALTKSQLPGLSDSAREVLMNSVVFAALAIAVCIPLSLLAVVSNNTFLHVLSSLPIVVSAATLGIGLVLTFDTDPFAWRAQWWLLPLVHAAIAFPLTMRTLQPAWRAIPESLRRSAATLGASPLRTFFTVEMPLLRPALLRATGLAGAVSLGEFGATSFLSRSGTTTLPIAIGELFGKVGQGPQQAGFALSASFVVLTVAVMSRA